MMDEIRNELHRTTCFTLYAFKSEILILLSPLKITKMVRPVCTVLGWYGFLLRLNVAIFKIQGPVLQAAEERTDMNNN